MEGRLLFKDASVVFDDGTFQAQQAVVIDNHSMVAMGPNAQHPTLPGDWEIDCRGRWLLPGRIDRVSSWIDSARESLGLGKTQLTTQQVERVTRVGLSWAMRHGITCVVEQLRDVEDVSAGLAAQAGVASSLGIRLVHSYRCQNLQELRANISHAERVLHSDPFKVVRVLLGVTPQLSRDGWAMAMEKSASLNLGFHAHSQIDVDSDLAEHAHAGSHTVWMSNLPTQDDVLAHQAHSSDWASRLYGGTLGRVETGSLADLILVDWVPSQRSVPRDAWQNLSFMPVTWTVISGRVTVREGQWLTVNSSALPDEKGA